jgi:hypothetical protein
MEVFFIFFNPLSNKVHQKTHLWTGREEARGTTLIEIAQLVRAFSRNVRARTGRNSGAHPMI